MWYKNVAGRFFGLVTKHACDRRTDGQMDKRKELRLPRPRYSIAASRGKNLELFRHSTAHIFTIYVHVLYLKTLLTPIMDAWTKRVSFYRAMQLC